MVPVPHYDVPKPDYDHVRKANWQAATDKDQRQVDQQVGLFKLSKLIY